MPGESIDLSVVLPIRDQTEAVRRTLESVHGHLRARTDKAWEILVVADGDHEGTCREVTEAARALPGILLLRNPGPIGCGYAARHGILLSRGSKILLIDPETPALITLLEKMERILGEGHDMVVASRRTASARPLPPVRIRNEMVSRSVELSIRLMARRRALRCPVLFHLYRRSAALEIYRRQRLDSSSFAVEILYLARRYRYSVIEIPIPEDDPSGLAREDGADRAAGLGELLRIRMHRLRGDYG
jgi:dolichyl-phosphate beta-glucosyltransferase